MVVPSLHRVVLYTFHIFRVEGFEPLQNVRVALKIPFYELLNWYSLISGRRGDVTSRENTV